MKEQYLIDGTRHLNPITEYYSVETYPNFESKVEGFKETLKNKINEKTATTFYKFGDGDYYFLKKQSVGSAKPGRRALKKPYFMINHKKFVEGAAKNDFYTSLIPNMHQKMFKETFDFDFDFPTEAVYGLLANKWIFRNFTNIGLIGADKKINLIKMLMSHDRYKEYLGIEKFNDYISIPQKYACDNLSKTTKSVMKQLEESSSDLFLVGVGHVKSGLLHELKKNTNAVFLDVGVGVDAIAGVININRPYFGLWKNYQIKNHEIYKNIDILINNNAGTFGEILDL